MVGVSRGHCAAGAALKTDATPRSVLHRIFHRPSPAHPASPRRYPPFYAEDNKLLYAQIAKGAFHFHDEAWGAVSAGAKDLVKGMLTVDPAARITLEAVLAHPWVVSAAGDAHLSATLTNMRRFNARRKIKAAAMAAAWLGSLVRDAVRKCTTTTEAAVILRARHHPFRPFAAFPLSFLFTPSLASLPRSARTRTTSWRVS